MRNLALVSVLSVLGSLGACKTVHSGGASEVADANSQQSNNTKTYNLTSFPYSDFAIDGGQNCLFPKPSNALVLELSTNCSPRIRSYQTFTSGKISASIQPPAGYVPGAVTAFYLSSGEGSANHSEVDFEFLGNHATQVQLNLFVNGVSRGGVWKELGFNVGDAPHDYSFELDNNAVHWYVDGKEIYSVSANDQPLPNKPMMIYASFWNAGDMLPAWSGAMDWSKAPFWYILGNMRIENAY